MFTNLYKIKTNRVVLKSMLAFLNGYNYFYLGLNSNRINNNYGTKIR